MTGVSVNYYKRFCGDYARDTAHLSLAEHGAFTLLLDHQYATEKPLPEDYEGLYRLCRTFTEDEQAIVRKIADEFFPKCEGGRFNPRAARQIPEDREHIDRARAKASKAASARWSATSNAPSITQAMPSTATAISKEKKPPDGGTTEVSQDKTIWKLGVRLLAEAGVGEPAARTFLGQFAKNGHATKLATVLAHLSLHPAADPKAYIVAAMQDRPDHSGAAWGEFRAATRAGAKPASWTHPQTAAALEAIGGWGWARNAKSRDLDFKEKQFVAAFKQLEETA